MFTRFDLVAIPALLLLCGWTSWQRFQSPDSREVAIPATSSITPRTDLLVEVTGQGEAWVVRYAGSDGKLHTHDDILVPRALTLPANCQVTLKLRSGDYLYGFSAPALRLREIAVPELTRTLQFRTGEPLRCPLPHEPMCGGSSSDQDMGRLEVMPEERFIAWMQTRLDHGATH